MGVNGDGFLRRNPSLVKDTVVTGWGSDTWRNKADY